MAHYGWVIALTGVAVLFSCLGIGRFSLGMLLPSMGLSLSLNYSQMGLIGTGNFVGYMVAVIMAGMMARTIGERWTIFIGLLLVGASMALIGMATGFFHVLLLYTATGLGSGLANVPMMGLVSHWFPRSKRGRAAGTMIMGNGFAIVFAGFFIPNINGLLGAEGWRTNWCILGIFSLCIAVVAGLFLRNRPDAEVSQSLDKMGGRHVPLPGKTVKEKKVHRRTMVHLGCIYALFGATYAVYATFIVTTMVNERGFGEDAAGTFWAFVGGLSIFSGPLFGWLSDRMGRKVGMQVVYVLFTISYFLVGANLSNPFLFGSITIFGLAAWSIPTIMSAAVGDYAGPDQAVRAFGFVTLFFGVGQITGPMLAGAIADLTGSFNVAFVGCACLTLFAVFLAHFLRSPSSGHDMS